MKAGGLFCGCEYGYGQETEARLPPCLDLPWALLTAGRPSLHASATTSAETMGDVQWWDSRQWAREPGMGNATRRLERRQFPPLP